MPIIAEHEICFDNKSQILTIPKSFLLNIAEHENFSASKYENHIYLQRIFQAQLS